MGFVFQQPGTSPFLDAVDDCASRCESMGGMFAFATKGGAELLLDLPKVKDMQARGGRVDLIVGLDAITNGEALLYLGERMKSSKGRLVAKAYLHPWSGTFHPKFMWFVSGEEVTVIVGSGNLTPSGLGRDLPRVEGNWEAFSVQVLDQPSSAHFLEAVRAWIAGETANGLLLKVDHTRSLERGAANSRMRYIRPPEESKRVELYQDGSENKLRKRVEEAKPLYPTPWPAAPGGAKQREREGAKEVAVVNLKPPSRIQPTKHQVDSTKLPVPAPPLVGADAFIRELSKNRPGQADVGQAGLEFFGFSGGAKNTVLLQYVSLSGEVSQPIEKSLFVNASDNYRVEMGEIAHFPYAIGENDERMILVAVRLDLRTYRYTLVPVDHKAYAQLSRFLTMSGKKVSGRMRTAFADSSVLAKSWSLGPSALFPMTVLSLDVG